jgi:ABC-type multidrug transport system ATPase subunit
VSPEDSANEYSGHGSLLFNSRVFQHDDFRGLVGYVQQFDQHYPMLTVMETLTFHATLRFASSSDPQKRSLKLQRVINLLGLAQCANTRVGGDECKGISGGEKRRLSIGVQLLVDPPVCLLDEPSTGLDAFTARHVVETLRSLARQGGRTVVMSIHQPRYDIFGLVDDVILLSRGMQVWAGSSVDMMKHFHTIGHPCPPLVNPADFILDISSIDFRTPDSETRSRAILGTLVTSFAKRQAGLEVVVEGPTGAVIELSSLKSPDFLESFSLLLHRSFINMLRQPIVASSRVSQGLFFALILCAFYAPVGDNQNSIQCRIGLLYELTALSFIGMLSCIAIFPPERNVFFREYADGSYGLLPFFLSYFVIAIPFVFITAVAISILMTHAIGLQPTFDAFMQFTFVLFCFMFAGECIGVIFCAMFLHVGFSVNIMSICLGVSNQFTGFVSLSIPAWLNYLGYVTPIKWGSVILTNIVFHGEEFTCSESEEIYPGQCPLQTGNEVLELYAMNYTSKTSGSQMFYLVMIASITATLFLMGYIVFALKVMKLSR